MLIFHVGHQNRMEKGLDFLSAIYFNSHKLKKQMGKNTVLKITIKINLDLVFKEITVQKIIEICVCIVKIFIN